jgi:hypothetical protein
MNKYLRKNDKPLQQLVKRLDEENRNFVRSSDINLEKGCISLTHLHMNNPLIDCFA